MDSVLEQDYPDLELLVMDDGSTDDTPSLLDEYASRHPAERFRFSRHENMGQARTLNRGYEMARGDVLGYLSDDDLLAPGAVSRLVAGLADPAVVCVYPGYRIIDTEGAVIDTVRPIEYGPVEAYRQMDTVIGPGGLVRRPVLETTGGWDPELRYMGDLILWMKVGLAGPVLRVGDPLALWRRHQSGLSVQVGEDRLRELLRLVDIGESLLGLPGDAYVIRAEALRNACIQAAFFLGGTGPSPGERFATIDLGRPGTSAISAGLGPTEAVDERADVASGLWREIAVLAAELGQARERAAGTSSSPAPPLGAGLDAARRLLERAGALPAGGEGSSDLRMAAIEAAVACGSDTDPKTQRYLVLERGTASVLDEEFDELNRLGFGASPDRLRAVIEDRRRKLEGTASLPKRADL